METSLISLRIGNSECSISGLSVSQLKELRGLLSYELPPEQAFFTGNRARKTSLLSAKGIFPTGLLYLVQDWLLRSQLNHTSNDLRTRPKARHGLYTMSLGVTPYREQVEAAEACLAHSRGIVVAPTGVGKSLIVALIINKLQVPTLVVVPTLELKTQLVESLRAIFGDDKVGTVWSGKVVGPYFPIAVENVGSLLENNLKHYDAVIVDEFHHSGAKSYRKLNKSAWSGIYYKFGMTATPFRSQDHEQILLESVLSQVIYEVDYHGAVDKGYIVPMDAYYIEVPKTQIAGNERSWPSMYAELIVNNEIRNLAIGNILFSLNNANRSTICLVKEIAHGTNLSNLVAHGDNELTPFYIKMFNEGTLKVLVGTTGVLGEGVDTRPAEYIIIAGLGKSRNQFMQSVGRGFRRYPGKESCKVIIILDKSHKYTRSHFKVQCQILLEEYGVIPSKLEI